MKIEISSKNNDNIKTVKKLTSSSKFRASREEFVIEGTRLCEEALISKVKITKVFYTKKCFEKFESLINKIVEENSADEFLVSEPIMEVISDTQCPQGIVCVCKFIDKKVSMYKLETCSNIILLENLQNPSNLGSIFRSLNAFGTDLVGITSDSCDIYNPKVLRGSMGAVFKLNIFITENLLELIPFLKSKRFNVCATVPCDEAENIGNLKSIEKKAVVLGNEGNGISKSTLDLCDKAVTIPMNPSCESLSVAVAAGIVAWEMSKKGECK